MQNLKQLKEKFQAAALGVLAMSTALAGVWKMLESWFWQAKRNDIKIFKVVYCSVKNEESVLY